MWTWVCPTASRSPRPTRPTSANYPKLQVQIHEVKTPISARFSRPGGVYLLDRPFIQTFPYEPDWNNINMTLLRPLASLPLIVGLLLNPVFGASEPTEITWDDLLPAEAQFDDPFTKLDEDQLFELSMVTNPATVSRKGKRSRTR